MMVGDVCSVVLECVDKHLFRCIGTEEKRGYIKARTQTHTHREGGKEWRGRERKTQRKRKKE